MWRHQKQSMTERQAERRTDGQTECGALLCMVSQIYKVDDTRVRKLNLWFDVRLSSAWMKLYRFC